MPPRHTAYFRGWRLGLVSAVFALAQPPTAQAFEGEVKARALPQVITPHPSVTTLWLIGAVPRRAAPRRAATRRV